MGTHAAPIIIEVEVPEDCGSLFRVSVDGIDAGNGLTAIEAQLIAGDAIEAFVFPQRERRQSANCRKGTGSGGPSLAIRRRGAFVLADQPRTHA